MDKSSQPTPGRLRGFLKRVSRVTLAVVVVLGILALIGGAFGWRWFDENILSTLPADLSEYRDYRPPTACQVYDAQGAQIDRFYVERRIWVPLAELDEWTWQAFIAAEDRRFNDHNGVDPIGIVRALYTNWVVGRDVQGASTLTQQLVKNLIVGKERSYVRKLKEAVLAYRLEKELSKSEILELYVNYIALGSGNYGVEAAAQDYFGISARDLDAGQAAMLAGLVPAPSRYSPRSDPEMAARRREIVLRGMVDLRMVEPDAAAAFLSDPVLVPRKSREETVAAAYVTQVRREIRRVLGDEVPFARGLQIHTPLDQGIQRVAERAIQSALFAHQKRQGSLGPSRSIPERERAAFMLRADGFLIEPATGSPLPPLQGECFDAMVGEDRDLGALRAALWRFSLDESQRNIPIRSDDPDRAPKELRKVVRPGDVLEVCLTGPHTPDRPTPVRLDDRPWSQGAAVVLENSTGRILAMVGGFEDGLEGFVRATQAKRQPGSSFKPYVYATAMLHGKRQIDTVVDGPISLGGWSPKNYAGSYAGALPLRSALAKSLNTVSVRLILETGVASVVRTTKAMGVQTPIRNDPTIALGSSEVTPMDQALGYATIARMGRSTEPVFIDFVKDVDGRVVGNSGEPVTIAGEAVAVLPGGPGEQALPPGVAYELADMMREVVQGGTARKARKKGYDRAGKTGTTNDYLDAWYVGFTPRHTVAIWIGTDGTQSLGEGETGGKTALPAWITIADALTEVEGERFPMPAEAILVPWHGKWVGLPRGEVPSDLLRVPPMPGGPDAPLPPFPDGSGKVEKLKLEKPTEDKIPDGE